MVGGGGKSSLLFAIEQNWPGHVVLTTTTRLFRGQLKEARSWLTTAEAAQTPEKFDTLLTKYRSCLLVERIEGDKAVGVAPDLPGKLRQHPKVDLVVVEADGSRRLPVKAPAAHEPRIPKDTSLVVIMVGIDALAAPIGKIAHRPERVADLTGLSLADHLSPSSLAQLLSHPDGGLKGVLADMKTAVCINKIDSHREKALAEETCVFLSTSPKINRVILSSLNPKSSL